MSEPLDESRDILMRACLSSASESWACLTAAQAGVLLATLADRDEAIRQRDELRAILAPLLEQPTLCGECVFCGRPAPYAFGHRSACPSLPANRDRLLGRDRAPAPPEAT